MTPLRTREAPAPCISVDSALAAGDRGRPVPDLRCPRADLEAHARVRRDPLPRMAVPEEHGPHGAGHAPARGTRAPRRRRDASGAGRTDAGVHALAQVAHLKAQKAMPEADVAWGLNERLPADINVTTRREGSPALPRPSQRHEPHVPLPHLPPPHGVRQAVRLVGEGPSRLRRDAPRREALRGTRTTSDRSAKTRRARSRRSSSSRRCDVAEVGQEIHFRITASHFLWKMVRRLAGTLVEVGRGNLDAAGVEKLLREKSATTAKWTAPPSGLFLETGEVLEGDLHRRAKDPRLRPPVDLAVRTGSSVAGWDRRRSPDSPLGGESDQASSREIAICLLKMSKQSRLERHRRRADRDRIREREVGAPEGRQAPHRAARDEEDDRPVAVEIAHLVERRAGLGKGLEADRYAPRRDPVAVEAETIGPIEGEDSVGVVPQRRIVEVAVRCPELVWP